MKIFNRGTETKAPAAAAPAKSVAVTTPAPAPAAPAAAPAPAAPASPAAPDLAVILDANVKEMSEKIARLASNLESSEQERTGFEAKIEQMEDRMRKLSSLTEMISAQYNPFVGDAPSERESLPRPEVGLAPPVVATTLPPPPEMAAATLSLSPEPSLAPVMEAPTPTPSYLLAPEVAPMPETPAEPGVYLWIIPAGFESSMLLLGWADMLLKSAGSREGLLELVNYYHNIGWIGDPARDQILAYADGLVPPSTSSATDWRANVEVHEKSLLFVEKLRAVSGRRSA